VPKTARHPSQSIEGFSVGLVGGGIDSGTVKSGGPSVPTGMKVVPMLQV
jgi:hypothetical protein